MPPNNPFAESHDLFLEQFEQVNHLFDFDEEILKIYDTIFGEQIKNLRLIKATAAVRKAEEMRIFLKEKMHLTQQLSVPFELLYDHAIVYSVSTLENFLSDIFQKCLTHYTTKNSKFAEILRKRNNGKDKDFSISPDLLVEHQFDLHTAIGSIVMENDKGINFQDLKCILQTFQDYFSLDVREEIQPLKDKVILAHASRHIILHQARRVNSKFLHQIRNTKYINKFEEHTTLSYDEDFVKELVNSLQQTGEIIYNAVKEKYVSS